MTTVHFRLLDPVPADVREALRKHLYWVAPDITHVSITGSVPPEVTVTYQGALPAAELETALRRAAADMVAGASDFSTEMVASSNVTLEKPALTDPFPDLVDRRWVRQETPGAFAYSGVMADAIEALDRVLRRRMLALGASAVRLPSLVSPATLLTAGTLPGGAATSNYVFHLQEGLSTPGRLEAVCDGSKPEGILDLRTVPNSSASPEAVLTSAVCQPFYPVLAGTTLEEPVVVTGQAPCYRYESGATEGLRRLREFTVRELVYVGSEEEVLRTRDGLVKNAARLLEELLTLGEIRTASDPFFMDTFARMRMYQLAFKVKHEYVAVLPFDGSEVAIGSINYHGDHFGRAWRIRTANGEFAHSCCMGFGLERWAYTVFSQHGLDPYRWPAELRRMMEDSRDQ
ncbi:aminoacyl--tRNA ligase-related protein [Streptomyces sp. NPDC059785]|uniref:aminoacyl--tRNA ligase-related protein n=1 Tax=unclassified Streptomyces TaxID=2593676 RepID=UPI00365A0CB4